MTTRISTWPAGLLGLLRAQNFGTAPGDLADTVWPVVEIRDQYIQNSLEHAFALFTPALGVINQDAPAGSGELLFLVPAGELWWIEECTLRLNPAAGIGYRAQVGILEKPAQFTALGDISAQAVNPNHFFVRASPGGFWMTPDTRLAVNFDTILGVPTAGSSLMTVRFARFKL